MHAVAMVVDGFVYGVLLMEGTEVKRAWIDPELEPGIIDTMTFKHDDPNEVMKKVQAVLDVRDIPEVDPKKHTFEHIVGGRRIRINPSLN